MPDGGSMRLPEDWQATGSNKGMVDGAGPEGARAFFGIWFPVYTPGSVPQQFAARKLVASYPGVKRLS